MRASVVIATYNSAAHVGAAIRSALDQTIDDLEVIVVDDASSDDTVGIVEQLARADHRVRVERLSRNGGPAIARNHGLAVARGEWLAVLDSDDLYAPDRLEHLIAAAEREGADIVSDNPVVFGSDSDGAPHLFLPASQSPRWITLDHYLAETLIFERGANYGYLKPIIRLERLRAADLRYNTQLRIAEDDELIVRMLIDQMRYWIEPIATYGYRKHAASISHRLSVANAEAMVAASTTLIAATVNHRVSAALCQRHVALDRALAFVRLIEAVKQHDLWLALQLVLTRPTMLPLLRMPLGAMLRRHFPARPAAIAADDAAIATAALDRMMADKGGR